MIAPEDLVARVPRDVAGKQDLLRTLARGLRFPSYFGDNWDALRDLLGHLDWVDERVVVLVHEGIPVGLVASDLRTYVMILQESVDDWEGDDSHRLRVVFPPEAEPIVHRLVWG